MKAHARLRALVALGSVALLGAACNLLVPTPEIAIAPDASIDASSAPTTSADAFVDASADVAPTPDAAADAPLRDASSCEGDADVSSDENNCGWCGHSCLGAACVQGLCEASQVTTSDNNTHNMQGINYIAPGKDGLFFTNWCSIATLLSSGLVPDSGVTIRANLGCGAGLARSGDSVFFGFVLPGTLTSYIDQLNPDGGAPLQLSMGTGGIVQRMFVDDNYVIYSMELGGDNGVYRIPRRGGTSTVLFAGNVGGAFAIDGDVFFTSDGKVMSVPKAGGAVKTLYTFDQPLFIVADAQNVYWSNHNTRSIYRGSRDGLAPMVPIAGPLGFDPEKLYVDETSIYATASHSVIAVDKDGKRLRTYASWAFDTEADIATAVSGDATFLYWGRNVEHPASLWRVAK